VPTVLISESPNLLDPSGPGQACNGVFFLYVILCHFIFCLRVLFLLVEKFRGKLFISIIMEICLSSVSLPLLVVILCIYYVSLTH
jgi:hypothetical protein